MKHVLLAAIVLAGFTSVAVAQTPEGTPERIRGTIDAVDDNSLAMTTREGRPVTLEITADTRFTATTPRSLDEIVPGTYVASAGVPGPDGRINAVELRILPAELKGAIRDGHFPIDLAPDASMTNATVAEVVTIENGEVLRVTHKDGETELVIGPDVPVYSTDPADRSVVVPGAYAVVNARRMPDGSVVANNIIAERDGLKPGM